MSFVPPVARKSRPGGSGDAEANSQPSQTFIPSTLSPLKPLSQSSMSPPRGDQTGKELMTLLSSNNDVEDSISNILSQFMDNMEKKSRQELSQKTVEPKPSCSQVGPQVDEEEPDHVVSEICREDENLDVYSQSFFDSTLVIDEAPKPKRFKRCDEGVETEKEAAKAKATKATKATKGRDNNAKKSKDQELKDKKPKDQDTKGKGKTKKITGNSKNESKSKVDCQKPRDQDVANDSEYLQDRSKEQRVKNQEKFNGREEKVVKRKSGRPRQGSPTRRNVKTKPVPLTKQRMKKLKELRSLGTWVECCKPDCQKWRFLPDVMDPSEVPEYWICADNTDKAYNLCSVPERDVTPEESHLIVESKYVVGSVVWAKLPGFPWWPALVDDDPDTKTYFWTDDGTNVPNFYHVVFFDRLAKTISRAWVPVTSIKRYDAKSAQEVKFADRFQPEEMMKWLPGAKWRATKASSLDVVARKEKFCHLFKFNGEWGLPWGLDLTGVKLKESVVKKEEREDIKHEIPAGEDNEIKQEVSTQ